MTLEDIEALRTMLTAHPVDHVLTDEDRDMDELYNSLCNLALKAWRSAVTVADEGYPGIAHDFETMRTALRELLDADLALAQLFNRSGRANGATVAEWNAVRQNADRARSKAHAALVVSPLAKWDGIERRDPLRNLRSDEE